MLLASISHNLRKLLRFSGRERRALFWPYAATVFILAIVAFQAAFLPEFMRTMGRMQRFAAEHPDQATVTQGPGHYSISIEGHHPELMPDMARLAVLIGVVAVIVVLLLAAAVARRLHDRGKSGLWGLMPVPFLAFAGIQMPRVFANPEAHMGLFFLLFFNNLIYIGTLIALVVMLARVSDAGDNRYGPAQSPPPAE
jgi:uncharacterized membrane protein YhaH (DUF805 family)